VAEVAAVVGGGGGGSARGGDETAVTALAAATVLPVNLAATVPAVEVQQPRSKCTAY
jgi:hypothetical protein